MSLLVLPTLAIAEPSHNEMGVYYVQKPHEHPVQPPPPELPYSIRSNCYAYAEYVLGELPSMATLQATAHAEFGPLAVFNYNGLPHVAVTVTQGVGYFTVKESNFEGDYVSERTVNYNDPSLIGFR